MSPRLEPSVPRIRLAAMHCAAQGDRPFFWPVATTLDELAWRIRVKKTVRNAFAACLAVGFMTALLSPWWLLAGIAVPRLVDWEARRETQKLMRALTAKEAEQLSTWAREFTWIDNNVLNISQHRTLVYGDYLEAKSMRWCAQGVAQWLRRRSEK